MPRMGGMRVGFLHLRDVIYRGLRIRTESTSRDLILTTAFGLPFRNSALFFRSLAATSHQGKVVVFAANLSLAECQAYRSVGAEVIDHGVHLHRVFRRPLQSLFWGRVRQWPDAGSFSPPWDRLQQANILRWSLYRRYLDQHPADFDRVLMVDLRDVFFQSDPFVDCDRSRLRVFAEEGDPSVAETRWNSDSMKRAFGASVLERTCSKRVSCSGVVLGGIEPVREYLQKFARLLPELAMPDHGADQCIHIRIIHELMENVEFLGNREAEVCHLHHVGDISTIPTNPDGDLLNSRGEPFAIVHQYDRHPQFAEHVRWKRRDRRIGLVTAADRGPHQTRACSVRGSGRANSRVEDRANGRSGRWPQALPNRPGA